MPEFIDIIYWIISSSSPLVLAIVHDRIIGGGNSVMYCIRLCASVACDVLYSDGSVLCSSPCWKVVCDDVK